MSLRAGRPFGGCALWCLLLVVGMFLIHNLLGVTQALKEDPSKLGVFTPLSELETEAQTGGMTIGGHRCTGLCDSKAYV